MRAYREIAKLFAKAQLSWRFNIASNMVFSIIKILFAIIVWGAVFEGQTEIAGFTLSSMLSYYVVNSFFSQLEQLNDTAWALRRDVRSGAFSKYMVIPVRPGGYFMARSAGIALLSAGFVLLAGVLTALLFRIPLALSGHHGLIVCALIMQALGLIFVEQLNFLIGLWSIKFLEIDTFIMLKENLAQFLTGAIVPLALLPDAAIQVMRLLPFYYVSYLPSMLMIGRNAGEAAPGLCTMALWVLALAIINPLCYNALRKRYDGVGI